MAVNLRTCARKVGGPISIEKPSVIIEVFRSFISSSGDCLLSTVKVQIKLYIK